MLRLLRNVAEWVMPRECVVCGAPLLPSEEHICRHCASDIPLTRYEGREHNPMADALNARIQERLTEYEPYSRACALFFYKADSPYANITKALKYRYDRSGGRFCRWKRGYNQAEVIAREMASCWPEARFCPEGLRRRSRTRSQARLPGAAERAANLRGAFRAVPGVRRPGHILLVDDVFTTGSTLCECHRALRAVCGPEVRISVAALGFVP